jgi:cyanophycinase
MPELATVFLIGGGRDAAGVVASHGPFAGAVRRAGGGSVVVLVLDEGRDTDPARWTGGLAAAGAPGSRAVVVSAQRPPRAEDVAGAGGVYVAGGCTPGYQEALVGAGLDWLAQVRDVPFAGFSAGAAIAARRALVGGWRARVGDRTVAVCDPDAGEDLEAVTVRDGLGLVPFTVDVHAAQWGTLGRLLHAVSGPGDATGLAIDEATAVEVDGDRITVHGHGAAYLVRRAREDRPAATVQVLVAGDSVALEG